MLEKEALLNSILDKCDICYNKEVISRETVIHAFKSYLSSSVSKERHNTGLILHTGSVCFDVVLVVFAAISNMIFNSINADDILDSLAVGDIVVYSGSSHGNYIYMGHEELGGINHIVLRGEKKGDRLLLAPPNWHKIVPFFGESKTLGRRGARKKKSIRDLFFIDVLGYDKNNIPSMIDTSTIIMMPRERADDIIHNTTLSFGDNETTLLELITASFFSDNNEYPYGGNLGKTEPVLKFTGRMSAARRLLFEREQKRNIGFIITDGTLIDRSYSELPEIIQRRSVQYVYISAGIDSISALEYMNQYEKMTVFACTRDTLGQHCEQCVNNEYTADLQKQIGAILRKKIENITFEGPISRKDYRSLKIELQILKNTPYDSDYKKDFVIQAYSLLNLFMTAVFPLLTLERTAEEENLKTVSPEHRLATLRDWMKGFPERESELAQSIVHRLETVYLNVAEESAKTVYLKEYLKEHSMDRIALVVPKAYYETVLRACGYIDMMQYGGTLEITTPNRFDSSGIYDAVIAAGNLAGSKFDIFRCKAAESVKVLLYDAELSQFKRNKVRANEEEKAISSRSHMKALSDSYEKDDVEESIAEAEELDRIDQEIEEFTAVTSERYVSRYAEQLCSTNRTSPITETIAIASFDNDEKVFFSKMYKAYVFCQDKGTVTEKSVQDLNVGDSIVFTRSTEETKDIVDEVLKEIVLKRFGIEEYLTYEKSKVWKEALIRHMKKTGLTPRRIAEAMIKNGVEVQEQTVVSWLDKDSHTVGPRKMDSIQQIGLLVENERLFDKAEEYYDACREVRKMRRTIMDSIGEAILLKLAGKKPTANTLVADVYDRVDTVTTLLRLESIVFIKKNVPSAMINRPINI